MLGEDDGLVDDDADQRHRDDGGEHLGGLRGAGGEHQQVAEPDVAADELADRHPDYRERGKPTQMLWIEFVVRERSA